MHQSTPTLNNLESSTYHSSGITNASPLSNIPITVSELTFQTESASHKRIKTPKDGLLFIFNYKDVIYFNTRYSEKNREMGSFQSIMVAPNQQDYIDLTFPKNSSCDLCIINVNKLENLGNFKDNFIEVNFHSQKKPHYWHTGIPNVKLSNFVNDLRNLNSTMSGNPHLLLGFTNIIVGSKLVEYDDYINGPKKQVDLRNDEIERVHNCIQYVKENYAQQLDVDMLCVKSTLTPQKLQTGFRELYGNTVTSFIKNFRLQKAEELMRTTELNVSQIVYSIGFTSRSYFSKIFKEKYETSPNDYMKKFKYMAA